ncbi:1367_t:CDS:2 [Funneliformis geosporum]|uniref:1372_t:CDS:1 n=1 Tax=Funneliformis geosporum TaxID=1117311 RepID=A0A9W4T112_9GLOM|nr:1367_t:CDS:2 [Funneliformis geosporum]CAI2188967.1 1372_t:CDS:2 [Funneliformis geosporum]
MIVEEFPTVTTLVVDRTPGVFSGPTYAYQTNLETQIDRLFKKKSGALSKKSHYDTVRFKAASISNESHLFRSNIKTERKCCVIHDGCVDSLSLSSEIPASNDEGREHTDFKMDKECEGCPN